MQPHENQPADLKINNAPNASQQDGLDVLDRGVEVGSVIDVSGRVKENTEPTAPTEAAMPQADKAEPVSASEEAQPTEELELDYEPVVRKRRDVAPAQKGASKLRRSAIGAFLVAGGALGLGLSANSPDQSDEAAPAVSQPVAENVQKLPDNETDEIEISSTSTVLEQENERAIQDTAEAVEEDNLPLASDSMVSHEDIAANNERVSTNKDEQATSDEEVQPSEAEESSDSPEVLSEQAIISRVERLATELVNNPSLKGMSTTIDMIDENTAQFFSSHITGVNVIMTGTMRDGRLELSDGVQLKGLQAITVMDSKGNSVSLKPSDKDETPAIKVEYEGRSTTTDDEVFDGVVVDKNAANKMADTFTLGTIENFLLR